MDFILEDACLGYPVADSDQARIVHENTHIQASYLALFSMFLLRHPFTNSLFPYAWPSEIGIYMHIIITLIT